MAQKQDDLHGLENQKPEESGSAPESEPGIPEPNMAVDVSQSLMPDQTQDTTDTSYPSDHQNTGSEPSIPQGSEEVQESVTVPVDSTLEEGTEEHEPPCDVNKDEIEVDVLFSSAIAADVEAVAGERLALNSVLEESEIWINRQRCLQETLERMVTSFDDVLHKFEADDQALLPEIREELGSRAEGIRLCARMLTRARNRLGDVKTVEAVSDLGIPEALNGETIREDVNQVANSSLKNSIKKVLKQRRLEHNQLISNMRQLSTSAEKAFLTLVERQVLPVIDGLDEGKKIGVAAVDSLRVRFPDEDVKLQAWFQTYDLLIGSMEDELAKMGIQPFTANPGDWVDYERFDPIDIEEDNSLEDEQVKETLRRGYWLVDVGIEGRVVRSGQVVVVRNPDE